MSGLRHALSVLCAKLHLPIYCCLNLVKLLKEAKDNTTTDLIISCIDVAMKRVIVVLTRKQTKVCITSVLQTTLYSGHGELSKTFFLGV